MDSTDWKDARLGGVLAEAGMVGRSRGGTAQGVELATAGGELRVELWAIRAIRERARLLRERLEIGTGWDGGAWAGVGDGNCFLG